MKHSLGLFPSTAIVLGSVIGSGIFVSMASMARTLPHAPLLLFLWVVGGIMTLFGALTLVQLASRMPVTGGPYEYLREIYGEKLGFFYGWATFVVSGAGGIAGVAFLCAHYSGEFFTLPRLSPELEAISIPILGLGRIHPFAEIGVKSVAASIIVFLTWLNYRGIKLGATLQSFSTTTKLALIVGIIALIFFSGKGSSHNLSLVGMKVVDLSGLPLIAFCFLVLSNAFWAYDGWINLTFIAGEVKNPAKTIPRATTLGILIVIAVYLAINTAYLYIIPVDQIGDIPGGRLASAAVSLVVGKWGALFVSALIVFSAFDCTNASILTYGRIYYAMAKEKDFLPVAAKVHPKFNTPHAALWLQCVWVLILLFSGSFDLITSMYVFVNWLFYLLLAVGLFLFRKRKGAIALPVWIPIIFCLFTVTFLVMTLIGDIQSYRMGAVPIVKSAAGIALVLSGIPFYLWIRSKHGKRAFHRAS